MGVHNSAVAISYDPRKREWSLKHRGLDFADAPKLLTARDRATAVDDRRDYGEPRLLTAAYLNGRMVVMVWTPRSYGQHIISMRHCHADEEQEWRAKFGR